MKLCKNLQPILAKFIRWEIPDNDNFPLSSLAMDYFAGEQDIE